MTLQEFLSHIKHNSLFITIIINDKDVFTSSIGVYNHWIYKTLYDNENIKHIEVMENHFVIYL